LGKESVNTKTEPATLRAARELAEEIQDGRWLHVTGLQTKPAFESVEIVAELRSRCPGLERVEYEKALATALIEYRPATAAQVFFFWFLAFTFVWALFVVPPLAKRFLSGSIESWVGLCGYPLICGVAAVALLRKKSGLRGFLAALNVASGVSWVVFVIWAARAFARSFWR
jgi:hypothetical protein